MSCQGHPTWLSCGSSITKDLLCIHGLVLREPRLGQPELFQNLSTCKASREVLGVLKQAAELRRGAVPAKVDQSPKVPKPEI